MHGRGVERKHILSQQLGLFVTLCRGQRWRLVDISRGSQGDLSLSGRKNRKIKHIVYIQHTKEVGSFKHCCLSEGLNLQVVNSTANKHL